MRLHGNTDDGSAVVCVRQISKRYVVLGTARGNVCIYDMERGTTETLDREHHRPITAISNASMISGELHFATAASNGVVRMWVMDDDEGTTTTVGNVIVPEECTGTEAAPIALAMVGGRLLIAQPAPGFELPAIFSEVDYPIGAGRLSPAIPRHILPYSTADVMAYRSGDGDLVYDGRTFNVGMRLTASALSPSGLRVAVGNADGVVVLHRDDGQKAARFEHGVSALWVEDDRVIVGFVDGTFGVYDSDLELMEFEPPTEK